MSRDADNLLVFRTGPIRFGVGVASIQRVVAACEVGPLPGAPPSVSGVVTMDGAVVAVVDPVIPFYPEQPTRIAIASRFLLVSTKVRKLAIIADTVDGVQKWEIGDALGSGNLPASIDQLKGIASAPDGLIYISDPDRLLSKSDELRLDSAFQGLSHAQ
jgi:purine-binding chemotaxis protein CheW